MISYAEFRRAVRRYWGHIYRQMGRAFALGAFVFAVVWLILEFADRPDGAELRAEAALSVAIIVALVAGAGATARTIEHYAREDPRLACPHCDGALGPYARVVLSSWNCPHCGERVLED
jgi:hypothetical protein